MSDFLRQEDAYQRICRVIGKHYPGVEPYYLIVDFSKFTMLAERKSKSVYFTG